MKRARVAAPLLLAALLVLGPAHASAPADQYQTFDAQSTTITDNFTLLTWQRDAVTAGPMSQSDALDYCTQLTLGSVGSGWRLPTYKELLTLVDEVPHADIQDGQEVSVAVDDNAFGGAFISSFTPAANMWTSTATADGTQFWVVDFTTGEAGMLPAALNPAFVRCVHD